MDLVFALFRYFPHGGLQRDTMRCAEAALARGHRVRLYCHAFEGVLNNRELELNVLPASGLSNHTRAQNFVRNLQTELQHAPGDLLVAFNRMPGADLYFAADNCLWNHARKYPDWYLRWMPRYRVFLGYENAIFSPGSKTRILYLTARQKIDYQNIYHTPDERFTLLPPGIPADRRRGEDAEERRAQKRAELGIDESELLLLQVGSGFHTKGVDRSIEAIAALPPERRDSVKFLVAGRENSSRYQRLAVRRGIADRVVFGGGRDDVPDLLLAADLLIHPARNEATGTVLIEALAAGTPVLCAGCCGFSNYVREAGSTALPEPFRAETFHRELAACLERARLESMKRGALSYGPKADFYHRADAAVDCMEEVAACKTSC